MWIASPSSKEMSRPATGTRKLVATTDQGQLDPLLVAKILGPVAEGVEVELRVQLAVDPGEQVEVERRADPATIVVRRPDDRRVLVQVEADEQAAAPPDQARDRAQEPLRRGRPEVADRGPREVDDPTGRVRTRGRQLEVAGEVVAHRDDVERGEESR